MARHIPLRPKQMRGLSPSRPSTWRIGAALLLAAGLQGCGDYTTDYPELAPTEQLLRDPVFPGHASGAARSGDAVKGELEARRGSLQAAGAGRAPAPDNGDLAQRAKDLRARADALRDRNPAPDPAVDPVDAPASGAAAAPESATQSATSSESQTSECPDNKADCTPASNQ